MELQQPTLKVAVEQTPSLVKGVLALLTLETVEVDKVQVVRILQVQQAVVLVL
jgi:hypothetical protein